MYKIHQLRRYFDDVEPENDLCSADELTWQGVAVDLKFGFGWKSAHSFGFSSLDDIQKEKLSFFAFFEKFDFFYSKKKLFCVGHKA